MKKLLCLVSLLVACRSGLSTDGGVDFSGPDGVNDLAYQVYDFAYPPYPGYDAAVPDYGINDLAYQVYDFAQGQGDMAHHGPHDFAVSPPDLAHPIEDLEHPVQDFARSPDFAGVVQSCEACLQATCSSQVQSCEADPHCTATLSCVVQSGCFTYSSGSQSFAGCVNECVSGEGLTITQQVAVLGEIAALATCNSDCVGTCGGK